MNGCETLDWDWICCWIDIFAGHKAARAIHSRGLGCMRGAWERVVPTPSWYTATSGTRWIYHFRMTGDLTTNETGIKDDDHQNIMISSS